MAFYLQMVLLKVPKAQHAQVYLLTVFNKKKKKTQNECTSLRSEFFKMGYQADPAINMSILTPFESPNVYHMVKLGSIYTVKFEFFLCFYDCELAKEQVSPKKLHFKI